MCHETSHVHARPRLVQESPVAQNKRQAKKKKKKDTPLSRSSPEVILPYMNPKILYVTYHFGYRIHKL